VPAVHGDGELALEAILDPISVSVNALIAADWYRVSTLRQESAGALAPKTFETPSGIDALLEIMLMRGLIRLPC
jgi:hypothetical protein